ncbi:MAG: TylF/MycF/NovP-related O-methyltransferase [Methanobacteriota archaeon]
MVIHYDYPWQTPVFSLINKIKGETDMILSVPEAYQIFWAVKRTGKIRGDVAEVGVYKGGSAKLICEARGDKTVHLFDTFKGIPSVCEFDTNRFVSPGEYAASTEEVKSFLKEYEGVHFYEGVFPDSAEPVKGKKFSFVHIDVDTYESTRDCLSFFYPRMSTGGVIIAHDYLLSPGVTKAVDEFFEDKDEPILELPRFQCAIVKTQSSGKK